MITVSSREEWFRLIKLLALIKSLSCYAASIVLYLSLSHTLTPVHTLLVSLSHTHIKTCALSFSLSHTHIHTLSFSLSLSVFIHLALSRISVSFCLLAFYIFHDTMCNKILSNKNFFTQNIFNDKFKVIFRLKNRIIIIEQIYS